MATQIDAPVASPRMAARSMKIGQLAALSGTTARNLRFYADAGVFGDLPRSHKGYRLFPPEAVHWVRMLRAAQAAGFNLDEIQALLRTLRRDSVPCGPIREALSGKLQALEVRLSEIQVLVDILRTTLGTPDGQTSELGCNLMETLLAQSQRLPARTESRT